MDNKREELLIDPTRCTGCSLCLIACSMKHHATCNQHLARIRIVRFKNPELNVPVICMACDDAPCIKACPMNARIRDANGTVVTDEEICIGCRACIYICPAGSPTINPYTGQTMTCDMCRGESSGPWCVTACRFEGALKIGVADSLTSETARAAAEKYVSPYLKARKVNF